MGRGETVEGAGGEESGEGPRRLRKWPLRAEDRRSLIENSRKLVLGHGVEDGTGWDHCMIG